MAANIRFSNSPNQLPNQNQGGVTNYNQGNPAVQPYGASVSQNRQTYGANNYNASPVRETYGQPAQPARINFSQASVQQPQPVQVRQTYQQPNTQYGANPQVSTKYVEQPQHYEERRVNTVPQGSVRAENDHFLCSRCCWILVAVLGLILLTLALLWGLGVFGKSNSGTTANANISTQPVNANSGTVVATPSGYNSNGQPTYAQPVSGQPTYAQPVSGQPTYAQPVNGQPIYTQPINGQPNYAQPINGQPNYAQPGSVQPNYAQPTYATNVTPNPV